MNETEINALLKALQDQRNAALNAAAQAEAMQAGLRTRIIQLEKDLALSQEALEHLKAGSPTQEEAK